MVLQEAVLPGRLRKDIGLVGLRVVLGSRQLLVGLARPAVAPKHRTAPWSLFGLAPLASVGGPASGIAEPILSSGGPIGDRAVSIAMQFLGVPYVWAGASPFSGFDCSGLTMFVYAQLGIHLIHFASAQYNEGTRIPIELLAPGDLVFFHPGPQGPGHEGIYIGAGEFIHAPHTGDVVRISALDGKYALSYVGAVRPYGP
jgi:cell wall-associated NlpC family hydrolase